MLRLVDLGQAAVTRTTIACAVVLALAGIAGARKASPLALALAGKWENYDMLGGAGDLAAIAADSVADKKRHVLLAGPADAPALLDVATIADPKTTKPSASVDPKFMGDKDLTDVTIALDTKGPKTATAHVEHHVIVRAGKQITDACDLPGNEKYDSGGSCGSWASQSVEISEVPADGKLPAGTVMFEVELGRDASSGEMKGGRCEYGMPMHQVTSTIYTIGPSGTCTKK